MRFRYDKSSKWLIETHADAILKLAGIGPVQSWRPLPGELVQSRQLPDGMVEVHLAGRPDPVLCLIEINTYSYTSVAAELLDDVVLTYLNRRVVPEVIALTLSDRGNVRVAPDVRLASPLGHTQLEAGWRVVNLWELSAADFLPLTDPGLAPWVPLMRIDGPPEPVLQQCKDAIEAKTAGGEQKNLLAVTEILAGLRYDERMLRALLRGGGKMVESPVLQSWFRERDIAVFHRAVLDGIEVRFGSVPEDVSAAVRLSDNLDRLTALHKATYTCGSLDDFRALLTN